MYNSTMEGIFILHVAGFWVLVAVVVGMYLRIKGLNEKLKHHPETEKALQQKAEKDYALLNIEFNRKIAEGLLSVKVRKEDLKHALLVFTRPEIYLTQIDGLNLRITDDTDTKSTINSYIHKVKY